MANATIEKILQYHFQDPGLLEEALQADGLTPSRSLEDPRTYGNRGLALIGDAILRLVVVNDGIELGKTLKGCEKISQAETSNDALSKILHKWKLDRYVRLPVLRGTVLGGTVGRSTAASTTEALVGAVWMDSVHDFDTVHRVVHNLGIATQLSQDVNHVLGNIESTMGELELV